MKFAAPQWLWFLLLLPLVYGGILLEERKRLQKLGQFANRKIWSRLIPEWNPSLRRMKGLALTFAVGFIFLALARPQFGTHEESVHVSGLDIMVVLDVSNSMETEDVIPTRLKKAKHLVKSLAERIEGDRLGLVAFAASSYVSCPLTTDLPYVLDTLDILNPNAIQNQGTDIGQALDTALRSLERGAEETSGAHPNGQPSLASRVIILISDGEDHEDDAIKAAVRIKESGARLFVLGVGTEKGGPVPVRDENGSIQGYKRDRSGQPVVSSFHPDFLTQVAREAGGKYWNVSASEQEVAEVIQELGGLDRTDFAERSYLVYEERFQIPLLMAFLLFILELSLPSRKGVRALLILVALHATFNATGRGIGVAQAAPSLDSYLENQKGLKAFQEGRMEEAQRSFGAAQARDPSQPEPEFNQGVIYLQQGEADKAIRSFSQSARAALERQDKKLLGKSLYNLGNSFAKKGDAKGAVQSYLGAIRASQEIKDTALEDEARKNLELLFQQIKKNKEEQKQKQEGQQKDSKSGKDQEQPNQSEPKQGEKAEAKPDKSGKPDEPNQKDQKSAKNKEDDQDKKNAQGNEQDQNKRYKQGPQQKFESKKLTPDDANRVMSELADREKALQEKLQTRHAKQKTASKDW